jgi:hypothetical protein
VSDRFPQYNVLAKRDTPSWNAQTRRAIDARLMLPDSTDVLTAHQHATLTALAARIVPQPIERPPVNTVAIVLDKLAHDSRDGYRPASLPPLIEAWQRGLDAIDAEAQARHGDIFAALGGDAADGVLRAIERGDCRADWRELDAHRFWHWRVIPDLVGAYYAHPSAWSAMGFGGPASPRGYVRLDANRRDPWEAAEDGDPRLASGAQTVSDE